MRVSGVRESRWSVPSVPTTVSWWSGPGRADQLAWIEPIAPAAAARGAAHPSRRRPPGRSGAPTTCVTSSPVTDRTRSTTCTPRSIRHPPPAAALSKNHVAVRRPRLRTGVTEGDPEAGDVADAARRRPRRGPPRTVPRTACSGRERARRRARRRRRSSRRHRRPCTPSACRRARACPRRGRRNGDIVVLRVRRGDDHPVDVVAPDRVLPAVHDRAARPTRRASLPPTSAIGWRTR